MEIISSKTLDRRDKFGYVVGKGNSKGFYESLSNNLSNLRVSTSLWTIVDGGTKGASIEGRKLDYVEDLSSDVRNER